MPEGSVGSKVWGPFGCPETGRSSPPSTPAIVEVEVDVVVETGGGSGLRETQDAVDFRRVRGFRGGERDQGGKGIN